MITGDLSYRRLKFQRAADGYEARSQTVSQTLLIPGLRQPWRRTLFVYVDRLSGNDTTGTGAASAPYLTLAKASATPPVGLSPKDRVVIFVRNGSSGTATANRMTFNNVTWSGVYLEVTTEPGQPNWTAQALAGSSEFVVRVFQATCVLRSMIFRNANWTLAANQQAVQGIGTPVGEIITNVALRNVTCSWSGWNIGNILVASSTVPSSGVVHISQCITSEMASVVRFLGMTNRLEMQGNSFGLGAGAGTWRVIDYTGTAARVAPNIISQGNTWTGNGADGMTFLGGYNPIITGSDKNWVFNDDFDLDGAASAAKFFNLDDCDASSTHNLRVYFGPFPENGTYRRSLLRMDTSGTVFNIGRNVGAYTNAQKPRAKTLADDCSKKIAALEFNRCDWNNANAGSNAALLAVRIGVMQTRIRDSRMTCPNSVGHSCNFISNNCTLENTYLEGELPILAFGDFITVRNCYSIGTRPFVGGKTGGGPDEASQGHTITDNVFVTTSADADYSAFDTYGWQANDPYGPVWYDRTDTTGANIGLWGWTVTGNRFVSTDLTETSHPAGVGRTAGAANHAGGKCKTENELTAFLADGNGGDGTWLFDGSVFGDNSLEYGSAPSAAAWD